MIQSGEYYGIDLAFRYDSLLICLIGAILIQMLRGPVYLLDSKKL